MQKQEIERGLLKQKTQKIMNEIESTVIYKAMAESDKANVR
jgi:hypothetical protein